MSGDAAVATHAVSKQYGRETALDDVNVRVPDGAVYVLPAPTARARARR
jgi:ABC-type multidrug transport system ATPase subunit